MLNSLIMTLGSGSLNLTPTFIIEPVFYLVREIHFQFPAIILLLSSSFYDILIRSLLHDLKGVLLLNRKLGHLLRILHWCLDQSVTNALAKVDLTAAQGPILGYLSRSASPPCPRDIEQEFHLTHPTVSGLLSRLEKKGFIALHPDETDRRIKRIHLLEKGRQCCDAIHQTILSNEEKLVRGFSEEEKELFYSFLTRATHNMGLSPCCKKKKEEHQTND